MKLSPTLLLLFLFLISLSLNLVLLLNFYQGQIVVSVPDGDTLQLKDGRRIRLAGLDAPEKGRCEATEARIALEQYTLKKRVTLTVITLDDYGRQIALVTVGRRLINEDMLAGGYAKYTSSAPIEASRLKEAAKQATESQKGIFSPTCRASTPPGSCSIKGNLRDGDKTYHLSGCKNYDQVIVDLSYGDQWFCTEKEAKEAGFEKAKGC